MQGEQLQMDKYGRREAEGKVQALERALRAAELRLEASEKARKEAEEKAMNLEKALEAAAHAVKLWDARWEQKIAHERHLSELKANHKAE